MRAASGHARTFKVADGPSHCQCHDAKVQLGHINVPTVTVTASGALEAAAAELP
jgi:hypothetical protein